MGERGAEENMST